MKFNLYRVGIVAMAVMASVGGTVIANESAEASFTCGPHLKTYSVRSLNGASGKGVRCVSPNGGFWYGEGVWGNAKYRHVGERLGKEGYAGDIFGNGEDVNGSFLKVGSLVFSDSGKQTEAIRVTGAWNEEWILAKNGVVQDYTSPLNAVRTCGNNFVEFKVSSLAGVPGNGVRCLLRQNNADAGQAWYGEGNWQGRTYAHIGSVIVSEQTPLYGAYDICEPSKFATCGAFKYGSLVVTDLEGKFLVIGSAYNRLVRGDWNEKWLR